VNGCSHARTDTQIWSHMTIWLTNFTITVCNEVFMGSQLYEGGVGIHDFVDSLHVLGSWCAEWHDYMLCLHPNGMISEPESCQRTFHWETTGWNYAVTGPNDRSYMKMCREMHYKVVIFLWNKQKLTSTWPCPPALPSVSLCFLP
jgi:hypothetical protein